MIPVTRTFLPPMEEYQNIIKEIWVSNQVANGGKLLFELQRQLQEYLQVENIVLTTNGTLPLQIALKNLANNGEVITTPFSYVALTCTIDWENFTPVFVDIHPEYLTIDVTKIEAAITEKTTAILATHVFGNPCDVYAIEKIASHHGLKVIYDAAHCFGVIHKGESLLNFGDISTCCFHATRIFHTGEGGAMFCKEKILYDKLFYSHNFGHDGPLNFHGVGINAKMNELQAGMGLAVLPYVEEIISRRKQVVEQYINQLNFSKLQKMVLREETDWNYSYYLVIFEEEETLLRIQQALNDNDIYPRRYFYPSLNTLDYLGYEKMSVSERISQRVLCFPLAHTLNKKEQEVIVGELNTILE